MRQLRVSLRRQIAASRSRAQSAVALLGADDPITQSLDLRRDLCQQALTAAGTFAWGAVGLITGARWGLFALVVAAGVELMLLVGIASASSSLRERVRDLIIEGRDDIDLPAFARERKRLLDSRRRARLAKALEDLVETAERWPAIFPTARPVFNPSEVLAVAADVRVIARLLVANTQDARGAALVERLLTSGASPLYARNRDDLRSTLESIIDALTARESW
jgi:FAD/FMN-containing dehydrogenase